MRRHGLVAVPVLLLALALMAPAATAADGMRMYRATVDEDSVTILGDLGVDLGHIASGRLSGGGRSCVRSVRRGQ
jgi:hypothetical protein